MLTFAGRWKMDELMDRIRAVNGPGSVQKPGVQKPLVFWSYGYPLDLPAVFVVSEQRVRS